MRALSLFPLAVLFSICITDFDVQVCVVCRVVFDCHIYLGQAPSEKHGKQMAALLYLHSKEWKGKAYDVALAGSVLAPPW
jgi:hypothetical protein